MDILVVNVIVAVSHWLRAGLKLNVSVTKPPPLLE